MKKGSNPPPPVGVKPPPPPPPPPKVNQAGVLPKRRLDFLQRLIKEIREDIESRMVSVEGDMCYARSEDVNSILLCDLIEEEVLPLVHKEE